MSQTAAGEVVGLVIRNKLSDVEIDECIRMIRSFHGKMVLDEKDPFPPATNEVIALAHWLCENYDAIKNADALILAHALLDDSVMYLYTTDKHMTIIARDVIKNMLKDGRRHSPLIIAELANID